ncbi:MAG TPA: hypothetical protein VFT01_04080 [Homoserinimonas sp.]|nr:hypothetical protein [Homoserinimonas sp.]
MARDNLFTRLELTRIHCHDEGDGPGSAEPYLWAVYFAVGGSTVTVSPSLTLAGEAITQVTPGSHGNLVNTDVDDGEDIPIPPPIGEWQTVLKPIPVPDSLSDVVDDVGGVVGVVVVLMEEDNVTDDGAETGHAAFNDAVRDAINQVVATRTVSNQDISDEELAAFEDQVADAVSDAVESQQNVFENIWSWVNPDDTIGFKAFIFPHDDLADQGTIEFSHRWRSEGDWEISGSVTATRICAAEALQDVFDSLFPKAKSSSLDSLRKFRDGPFRQFEGLLPWWRVLERNTPAIALVLRREPELRESGRDLFRFVTAAAEDLDAPLDASTIDDAARLAREISRRTGSRRLRIDAGRLADILPTVKGETIGKGIESLAAATPARNIRGHKK